MVYRVRIEKRASKAIENLEHGTRKRVVEAIRRLAKDPYPSGSKKLRDREGWRIRVGEYRVIYSIIDEELLVLVVKIGHRKDVYR